MIEVSSSSIACPCDCKGREKKTAAAEVDRAAATAAEGEQQGGRKEGDKGGTLVRMCVCSCRACCCVCRPLCPLALTALPPSSFRPLLLLAALSVSVFPVLAAHRSLTAHSSLAYAALCRAHILFSRVALLPAELRLFSFSPLAGGANTHSFRHHAA